MLVLPRCNSKLKVVGRREVLLLGDSGWIYSLQLLSIAVLFDLVATTNCDLNVRMMMLVLSDCILLLLHIAICLNSLFRYFQLVLRGGSTSLWIVVVHKLIKESSRIRHHKRLRRYYSSWRGWTKVILLHAHFRIRVLHWGWNHLMLLTAFGLRWQKLTHCIPNALWNRTRV